MKQLIEPALKDEAFLQDVQAASDAPERLHLWWLGQSGFLLVHAGRPVLLDPYLSDSLTEKYANTDKPHVRMTSRVIHPGALNDIDVVTSSHNHTDHLDAETLVPLIRVNGPSIRLVAPEANRDFIADRLGVGTRLDARAFQFVGLDDGQVVSVDGVEFVGVPSAHETLETDGQGRHKYLGYVVRSAPWTVYHSGDTVFYDGMVDKLRPFNIDIALLPINGRAPERRVAGNLSGREAAWLAKEIGAKLVIPCHYDMFEFNTATPDEFVAECERLGQPYKVLRQGERLTWSG